MTEPRLLFRAMRVIKPICGMVLSLLARQRARVPLDAADALAVAICHIHAAPRGTENHPIARGC